MSAARKARNWMLTAFVFGLVILNWLSELLRPSVVPFLLWQSMFFLVCSVLVAIAVSRVGIRRLGWLVLAPFVGVGPFVAKIAAHLAWSLNGFAP
jgi:hypothetical protein